MFDYKQRPTTKEYLDNWDAIFGKTKEKVQEHKEDAVERMDFLAAKIARLESKGYFSKWTSKENNDYYCVVYDGNGHEVARGWNAIEAYEQIDEEEV